MAPQPHQQRPPQQSKRHRKRHIPAGPAGLWMQSTTQQQQDEEDDDNDDDQMQDERHHHQRCGNEDHSIVAVSPAWTAAHVMLGISTPSLPVFWNSSRKYEVLQRYYDSNEYQWVQDIVTTNGSWRLQKQLLVQITSIQSISLNDHLWTVTLTDETNASITAWIQPGLVRHEQQTHELLREGNVLVLRDCSLLLVQHEEYILLIGRDHIKQCFSAQQSDQLDHAAYIRWMEARNQLTMELREQNVIQEETNQNPEEDERDAMEPLDASKLNDVAPPKAHVSASPVPASVPQSPSLVKTLTQSREQAPPTHSQQTRIQQQLPRVDAVAPSVNPAAPPPSQHARISHQEPSSASPPATQATRTHPSAPTTDQGPPPRQHAGISHQTSSKKSPPATQATRKHPRVSTKSAGHGPPPSQLAGVSHQTSSRMSPPATQATRKHPRVSSDSSKVSRKRAGIKASSTPNTKSPTRPRSDLPTSKTRKRRKRSLFPSGCSKLLTKAAWEEMQKYLSEDEDLPVESPKLADEGSPIFSSNFQNLCPSFFSANAFAGVEMDDFF